MIVGLLGFFCGVGDTALLSGVIDDSVGGS